MANFFPAASRQDIERAPSLNRRGHSRNALREAANDSPSDSRPARPSHINWLQNSMATTQAGPSTPRRPPSVQLGRSASLSALKSPPPALRRQSSLISHHSLQDKSSTSRTGTNPVAAPVKQLSPISEQSYVPTPKQEHFMDMEPTTPVSIGSTYSAFLRRPLKRSISATSTSSLRTDTTPTHPPVLPPLNISPLEIRPVYPPVSHRSGQQLVSTVYEDAGSERTGSFVTARSDSDDEEDAENAKVAPLAHAPAGPSNSTTFSATMQPGSKSDPDRATEGTTALGSSTGGSGGSGSGDISNNSNSAFGPVPPARPRPRRRAPALGGSGSGSEGSIWHRWTRRLSVGSSRLSRASFSAAHRAIKSRLPPLPIILFWAGFLAPWCWLIGGWLIAEGRWEDNGRARAALPLWKPRPKHHTRGTAAGKRPRVLRRSGGGTRGAGGVDVGAGVGVWGSEMARDVAGGPQLPFDPFAKDLEQGDAAAAAAPQEIQAGAGAGAERGRKSGGRAGGDRDPVGGPREWWYWVPCAGGIEFTCLPVRHGSSSVGPSGGAAGAVPSLGSRSGLGPGPGPSSNGETNGEKVVTFVKPYSAEVWVYRCRVAAVLSAPILLTALIVALVVIRSTNT